MSFRVRLLDDEATDIDHVLSGLERIGQFGFGRTPRRLRQVPARSWEEVDIPSAEDMSPCYPLPPWCGRGQRMRDLFTPSTGRQHGDVLAQAQSVQNPVIMA
jgi:hypothetical protein